MLAQIQFGERCDELLLPDEKLLGRFEGPPTRTKLSPLQAARIALNEPLEAPELHRACTPDDHVAIVLDPNTPRAAELLAPLIECLNQKANIPSHQISVIYPAGGDEEALARFIDEFPEDLADVQLVEHHPDDEQSLAYLASTQSGQRVYLNRVVVEADFVLVVGASGFDSSTGRRGLSSALFPALSNSETLALVGRTAAESRQSPDALYSRQSCQEVARLAGLFYGMAVGLDARGGVEHCWFGRFDAVEREASEYADRVWSIDPPASAAELVIAVCSPPSQANWCSVGNALESARRLLTDENGQIVLITDLKHSLGTTAQWLRDQQDPWEIVNRARTSGQADSLSTVQLASALAASRIYLLSGLADDVVDSMGMVPVASMHEIENLIESVGTIYLLESADRVHVRLKKVSAGEARAYAKDA